MTIFWRHHVAATVAGLEITDPKIAFRIKREADSTPPDGYIEIHNLNTDTERQIYERGDSVILRAGYGTELGLIFDGAVQRVERERINLARITRLKITGKVNEKLAVTSRTGTTIRSYLGQTTVRQVVTDIVSDMGLTLGPVDLIPADAMLNNFHWAARSGPALSAAIRELGLTWYELDGTIRFNAPGTRQPDASNVQIDPENGLLESPVITDEGARVRSLLNPNMVLGDIVQLRSETLSGQFKIITIQHSGDNWDGHLHTEMELRELQ